MSDHLERSVRSIKGDGPAPEFVAHLRKKLAEEASETAADTWTVVHTDLLPEPEEPEMTTKRWTLLALVAATALAIAAGVVMTIGRDDDTVETADQTDVSTTEVGPEGTGAAPPVETEPEAVQPGAGDGLPFEADAALVTQEFAPIAPGTHRADSVGTPFSFVLDEEQAVQDNGDGRFIVTAPGSFEPGDRDIVFVRLSMLSDPTEPTEPFVDMDSGWPANDFIGWLDQLQPTGLTSDVVSTTVGGLTASRVDVQLGEVDDPLISGRCGRRALFCLAFGTNRLVTTQELDLGSRYRIWVVDQNDEDPLAIIVGIDDESDSEWFDVADDIIATVAFGDVAPNPVASLPAGSAELDLLGGVRIELTEETAVLRRWSDFGRLPLGGELAETAFLTNPRDPDGNEFGSVDELVAQMRAFNSDVTEIESELVGGTVARVFDVEAGVSGRAPVFRDEDDEGGWFPPRLGRLWLIDHPDRGLLMVTAEEFDDDDEVFARVLERTEQILGSLEFIEVT